MSALGNECTPFLQLPFHSAAEQSCILKLYSEAREQKASHFLRTHKARRNWLTTTSQARQGGEEETAGQQLLTSLLSSPVPGEHRALFRKAD